MKIQLDLQFFAGEKTEKATPRKRQDERKKGKVAKSTEVNTAVILLFSFIILTVFGSFMKEQILQVFHQAYTEYVYQEVTIATMQFIILDSVVNLLTIIAPVILIVIIAALAANLMQIGFLFTTEPLKFDLKKIDPIQGAKRIFSIRALVELTKSLLKISFIGSVTFVVIWIYKDEIMMLPFKELSSALSFFGQVAMTMGIAAAVALLFLSVFDYAYQRFDFEKNLRMSKQDIKDEHKNMEGDPLIKSKIRERQRMMAMRRMMEEVPHADVIITNPTHYSIAIRYDEEKATAPFVVAKGVDLTALRIREIAKEHNVPLVENRLLARSLFEGVEINEIVPEEFYQAIAEILAYVYRLENRI